MPERNNNKNILLLLSININAKIQSHNIIKIHGIGIL